MTKNHNDDANNDAGAYVLNALNEKERIEFEAQLAESEEARNEVTELSDAAMLLGLAVEPVQPSPELKTSIMAKLSTTPQLPREVPSVRSLPDARPATAASAASSMGTESMGTERKAQGRWFQRPTGILMAAAAAVALFVGGNFVGMSIASNDFEVRQATALAQLQTAEDAQQAQVELDDGATATLIWSLEQRKSVVMIDDLDPLPAGKTYQLWYIGESGPISAGTFEAADSGASWRVLDGQMTGGDVVGVTVEPDGGSKQPTTAPIIAFESA